MTIVTSRVQYTHGLFAHILYGYGIGKAVLCTGTRLNPQLGYAGLLRSDLLIMHHFGPRSGRKNEISIVLRHFL